VNSSNGSSLRFKLFFPRIGMCDQSANDVHEDLVFSPSLVMINQGMIMEEKSDMPNLSHLP
jgi:hypothetical protein